MATDAEQQEYEFLVSQLASTGKPWDDRGYCFMHLQSGDAATWLRTVPDQDFIDTVGLADDALQAHLVKLLETTGEARQEAKDAFCDWLIHRALISAAAHIYQDVYAYDPSGTPAFLRKQA